MISLRKFSRLTEANPPTFREELTNIIGKSWKRNIKSDGGYWLGSYKETGNSTTDLSILAGKFYEELGCHIEEKSGGFTTFEGLIYEMELSVGGISRRRSLSLMADYVFAKYQDTDGNPATSSAAQDAKAIAKYGRREEMLLLDGFDQAAVEARRDRYLLENAYPWARPVGIGVGDPNVATLSVQVAGYVFTSNWRYLSDLPGTDITVSDWIKEIRTDDCEFLLAGAINTNALTVKQLSTTPQRAWDRLALLTSLGDVSGNPWRIYVDQGRYLNYKQITTTPEYAFRNGKLVALSGDDISSAVDPWRVRPGVVRDMDYPISRAETGGWLDDVRDTYITEVEVSLADEKPVLKTELFDEAEILADQEKYMRQMEKEAQQ